MKNNGEILENYDAKLKLVLIEVIIFCFPFYVVVVGEEDGERQVHCEAHIHYSGLDSRRDPAFYRDAF